VVTRGLNWSNPSAYVGYFDDFTTSTASFYEIITTKIVKNPQ
jgi:hypothetical protein